ncbi:hypothetical protein LXL04_003189 [Taraxacum kok-saghyz]
MLIGDQLQRFTFPGIYYTTSNYFPTIYNEFYEKCARICQNRDNRHERLGLANLGLESENI